MFKRKYIVLILDENWSLISKSKLQIIPRQGELIFLGDIGKYFSVLNVVHNLASKQDVILIVRLFENKLS